MSVQKPVWRLVTYFAVLTDIDINGCDMQMETPPPSVPATFRGRPTSYRLNSDVFFMSAGDLISRNRLMIQYLQKKNIFYYY